MNHAALTGTTIVVPGSISNLGPSFDALSVAVQLYIKLTIVDVVPAAPDTVEWMFDGQPPSGDNRIATAYDLARARVGTPAPGLRVRVASDIPQTAGLGSSAAAAVAGLRLYEAVTAPRAPLEWLSLASELEGHPDNAAAALLGGLAISCELGDGRVTARTTAWPDAIRLIVATPELGLHTSHARAVLPQQLPLQDAIFNLQRALLFVRALESGAHEDLREAMADRWHQPSRAPLVPGLAEAIALDDPAILGVCLSGAGPSILALATVADAPAAAARLRELYDSLGLPCTIRSLSAHQPATDAAHQ